MSLFIFLASSVIVGFDEINYSVEAKEFIMAQESLNHIERGLGKVFHGMPMKNMVIEFLPILLVEGIFFLQVTVQ